jgi:hypothetical protein
MRLTALKIALIVIGLAFTATGYFAIHLLIHPPANGAYGDVMISSIYFTLGIFLLLAVPNPRAHRSLILFAGWSSFAHALTMGIQALRVPSIHRDLYASIFFVVIGAILLALAPRAHSA